MMDTLTAKHKHDFISDIQKTTVKFAESLLDAADREVESLEVPTTRVEAWKYTRLARIKNRSFTHSSNNLSNIDRFKIIPDNAIVFVNGEYSKQHSTWNQIEGVEWNLFSEMDSIQSELPLEGELFNAINTAYLNDGVSIKVKRGANIEKSLQILHILTGENSMSNFRINIQLEDNAEASFVIGYFSDSAVESFSNVVNEYVVGKNARLTVHKLQYENDSCFNITTENVDQERDSTFNINTVTLNGGLVRNNLSIAVNGENSYTNLYGTYILKGNQHVDNHTVVDQKVANCESNELYKGVMDDKSTGVFNGKVFVRPDAQKVNAFQSNGNVLLSDDATINSKPELEIYADDVKCSHGSTTGQLDDEAVFYLRSRGISEESAKQLMVAAFIEETFDNIDNEDVLDYIHQLLKDRFGWSH